MKNQFGKEVKDMKELVREKNIEMQTPVKRNSKRRSEIS